MNICVAPEIRWRFIRQMASFRVATRVLLLVLAAIQVSCANVAHDYRFEPDRAVGLVIGSITYDSSVGEYRWIARADASGQETRLRVGDSTWTPFTRMYDDGLKTRGGTFAVELPAGRYHLVAWQIQRGFQRSTSVGQIGIPFVIDPARATYIGNLHFSRHWEASLRDQSERDIPVLKQRYVALNDAPLGYAISPGTNLDGIGGQYQTHTDILIMIPVFR